MDPAVHAIYLYFLIILNPDKEGIGDRYYKAMSTVLNISKMSECEDRINNILTSNGQAK